MTNRFVKGVIKLCLNLVVLVGLALLIRYGYQLFTTPQEDPLRGSIFLILGFVAWIVVIRLSKSRSRHYWLRYKGTKPGFKLTTFSVIAILLILTFAGVQPMSTYKDGLAEKYVSWQEVREEAVKAREVAEREKLKRELSEVIVAMPPTITEALPKVSSTSEVVAVREAEKLAFTLINMYREENGVPTTLWDDKLYELSKAHTQKMADMGELFHGQGDVIGENAWGGRGYTHYSSNDLAMEIAASWVNSPLHNAWLLYTPIKESVVSIAVTSDGQYASWSFWINKLSGGPDLVMKISREYRNSGSSLDWISWLKSKGYLH